MLGRSPACPAYCAPWHAHATLSNQPPEGIFSFFDPFLSFSFSDASFWGHFEMSDYVWHHQDVNSFLSICAAILPTAQSILSPFWAQMWAYMLLSYMAMLHQSCYMLPWSSDMLISIPVCFHLCFGDLLPWVLFIAKSLTIPELGVPALPTLPLSCRDCAEQHVSFNIVSYGPPNC